MSRGTGASVMSFRRDGSLPRRSVDANRLDALNRIELAIDPHLRHLNDPDRGNHQHEQFQKGIRRP